MPSYVVRWDIDIEAESKLAAVVKARSIQLDKTNKEGQFDVSEVDQEDWELVDVFNTPYEVDTWFFMRVTGLDDDDGVDRHTPVGSLVYIAQTFEGEDNYSILCPANDAGFFMNAEEIRTKLMPVPTVYDSLEADDENSIADRYTVFPAGEIEIQRERYNYLGCSLGGRAFSQWGELYYDDVINCEHLGRKAPFHELDADTQRHIFNRLKD